MCERWPSHTNYITASTIINIAPFGTDEMTESLKTKNMDTTFLIIIMYMAIGIYFYRSWSGFMLLEKETLNVFKLVIFNIQRQLHYMVTQTIRNLPSLKINLAQSSMNTQTQFNTQCYSSRISHSEKY